MLQLHCIYVYIYIYMYILIHESTENDCFSTYYLFNLKYSLNILRLRDMQFIIYIFDYVHG